MLENFKECKLIKEPGLRDHQRTSVTHVAVFPWSNVGAQKPPNTNPSAQEYEDISSSSTRVVKAIFRTVQDEMRHDLKRSIYRSKHIWPAEYGPQMKCSLKLPPIHACNIWRRCLQLNAEFLPLVRFTNRWWDPWPGCKEAWSWTLSPMLSEVLWLAQWPHHPHQWLNWKLRFELLLCLSQKSTSNINAFCREAQNTNNSVSSLSFQPALAQAWPLIVYLI